MAKRCLAIGADTLSRVVDEYDRDTMIFADGAGATIIEDSDEEGGILSHKTESYTVDELYYLFYKLVQILTSQAIWQKSL